MPAAAAIEPIPAGSVLLHIGPYKTGTTALQGAFHISREALTEHGVHYAGRNRQPMLAALATTGRKGRRGDPPAQPRHWDALREEVASYAGRKRVVVSSEFFADAEPQAIPGILDGLGGPRVHVVLTLRPLARIIPSQWQQYVQNGLRMGYEDWLDHMLNKPPYVEPSPTFWNRHDHAKLLARWVGAAGAEHVSVVAVDDADRQMLMRTFEALVDVPAGTLTPEQGVANRSLSLAEVEFVRAINVEFRERKWSNDLYGRVVRNGIVKPLQAARRPDPDEPVIVTPRWAVERACEIGRKMAAEIAGSGVRIIGDLEVLHRLPPADAPPVAPAEPPRLTLPVDAVVLAVVNSIAGTKKDRKVAVKTAKAPPPEPTGEDRPVASVATSNLMGIAAQRIRRRIGIKVRARLRR